MRPRAQSCPWTHQMMRPQLLLSTPLLPPIGIWAGKLEQEDGSQTEPAPDGRSRRAIAWAASTGFLVAGDARNEDLERDFRGLREMPEDLREGVDARCFGPGERIVFEPYTREMFERTHHWMASWDLCQGRPKSGPLAPVEK
jgi:hypothetical protein